MCNGICRRLYPAKRLYHRASMYLNNVRCTHCETFINRMGIYKGKTTWRCKCCGYPVRWTPYSGRKSINMKGLNEALIKVKK